MSGYKYYCIGCGKPGWTTVFHPKGMWVCTECRKKKVKIPVDCTVCGKEFLVSFDTYRMKDPNLPWRCRRCNDDYRNSVYAAKSDEEKKAFVEKQIANTKRYYANMTDEERKQDHERRVNVWKKRKEEGVGYIHLERLRKGRAVWWANLSKEEKAKRIENLADVRNEWWDSLTQEEKDAEIRRFRGAWEEWHKELTDEEIVELMSGVREGNKKFWDEMTPERFRDWRVSLAIKLKEYKEAHIDDDPANDPDMEHASSTEVAFMNILNANKFRYIYQYPSTKVHPEFVEKFPKNLTTGSDFVDPTHVWDFMVRLKGRDCFIDVDGFVHSLHEKVLEFNDSKRPYQTDGNLAFVIDCVKDNELTDDSKVINVNNGEVQDVRTLVSFLRFLND